MPRGRGIDIDIVGVRGVKGILRRHPSEVEEQWEGQEKTEGTVVEDEGNDGSRASSRCGRSGR